MFARDLGLAAGNPRELELARGIGTRAARGRQVVALDAGAAIEQRADQVGDAKRPGEHVPAERAEIIGAGGGGAGDHLLGDDAGAEGVHREHKALAAGSGGREVNGPAVG